VKVKASSKYGAWIKAVGRSEEEKEWGWSSEHGAAALLLEGVVARRVQQWVFALPLLAVANELPYGFAESLSLHLWMSTKSLDFRPESHDSLWSIISSATHVLLLKN
jgi:hypothetical protein